MDDVTLRPATHDDQAALGRYGGALMRQHHDFDPQRFIRVDDPERGYGRFLLSQLDEPDMHVIVAERAGVVVGYAYVGLEPHSWKDLRAPCGYLHDLYVDENARGHHIGERLLRAAVAWAQGRGAPRMVLMSAARNLAAQRLFARFGFRETMVEMTCEMDAFDAPTT
jgi:ribosomal protein S18 acetylase RimI-like enzyme